MSPWWLQSKCASLTPKEADALFFPSSGGKPQRADSYCHSCPVMDLCLNNAIVNKLSGFFAGTTDEQRRLMRHWIDDVIRLSMPPEPDRTERKRYLHVVEVPDHYEWLDTEEPPTEVIQLMDNVRPTAVVWDAVI